MADLSDVERALVTLIAAPLFPGVSYQPGSYLASAAGLTVKVVRGWPLQDALMVGLAAGNSLVSVFSEHGMTRNVSRWFPAAVQAGTVAPTITAAVSGATVTLGGTVTAGNVVGLQAGAPLRAYATIIIAGDTLASVAARLAAKVSGATVSNAVITVPSPLRLAAGVMMPQTVLTVTRQQEQGIRISIWAPTPAARDTLVSLIDNAMEGLKTPSGFLTAFFPVTAYENARLAYRTSYSTDIPARERIWRRDLVYTVEYPTTLIEQDPVMLFGGGTQTIGITGTTRQLGALPPS